MIMEIFILIRTLFFLKTIVLNQKTGTVIPILRFARDRP